MRRSSSPSRAGLAVLVSLALGATGCGATAYSDAVAKTVVEACLTQPAVAKEPSEHAAGGYRFTVTRTRSEGTYRCGVADASGDSSRSIDTDLVVWRLYQTLRPADVAEIYLPSYFGEGRFGASVLFSPTVRFALLQSMSGSSPNQMAVLLDGDDASSPLEHVRDERRRPSAARRFESAASSHRYGFRSAQNAARAAYRDQKRNAEGSGKSFDELLGAALAGHQTAALPGEPGTDTEQFTPAGRSNGGRSGSIVIHTETKEPEEKKEEPSRPPTVEPPREKPQPRCPSPQFCAKFPHCCPLECGGEKCGPGPCDCPK